MVKVVCSRFLPIGTHTCFFHLTLVIWIFVYLLCIGKVLNSYISLLKFWKHWSCIDFIPFDPKKLMIKVVCSRFLHIGTQIGILHRTLVILIFVYRKDFKLISLALKILETPGVSQFCSIWLKKINDKSCMFKFSSYCDSHWRSASDVCNSNFYVLEKFQTHISCS